MAITYPIVLPAQGIASIRIRPRNVVAVQESPFTLTQQVQAHQGQRWEIDVSYPPLRQSGLADEVVAALTSLRGPYGTFILGDSSRKLPRGTQAIFEYNNRTTRLGPIVSGAGQSGNSIVTSRWTASSQCLKAGDYIQIGASNLLLRSNAFDHATWAKANVTITANNAASPENHEPTGAERVVVGASGDAYIEQQFTPSTNGDVYTFSVWLRTNSGTANISIALQSESAAYVSTIAAVTTTWTRFSVTAKMNSASFTPVAILGRTTGLPNGLTFFVWGAQVNIGSEADQYVPTTSAVVSRTTRLHKVISDCYSTSVGICPINIWPRIRETPADGEFIKVHNCVGTFRLAGDIEWDVDSAKTYGVSFSAVEAL